MSMEEISSSLTWENVLIQNTLLSLKPIIFRIPQVNSKKPKVPLSLLIIIINQAGFYYSQFSYIDFQINLLITYHLHNVFEPFVFYMINEKLPK